MLRGKMRHLFTIVIMLLFLFLIGCQGRETDVPWWIPIPDTEEIVMNMENMEANREQTKYVIAISTKEDIEELHSFYNEAFQEWTRLQWDYQPVKRSLNIAVTSKDENTQITRKIQITTIPNFKPATERNMLKLQVRATEGK